MWPSENPWPVIFLCVSGAVGLMICWSQFRRRGLLVGAAAAVLLALIAWIYDLQVVTDTEQIRQNVYNITRAFQKRDLDATISYVSPAAKELRLIIGSAFNMVEVHDDMRVTDVRVEVLSNGERAKSRFRVNATITTHAMTQRISSLWEARWQPEEGTWKMIDILQFDPLNGEQLHYVDALRHLVKAAYQPSR
jgi:hypothetical protein